MKITSCEKVFVYYNLHKHCWSVKALDGVCKGRIVKHCYSIALADGLLKVSQAGRQRVLKEKRKNVHAGCQGKVISLGNTNITDDLKWERVTYNPYKYDSFVLVDDPEIKVDKFKFCKMEDGKVLIVR